MKIGQRSITVLGLLLVGFASYVSAASIVPNNLCKLYVGSKVFNLTGVREHDTLKITKFTNKQKQTFTVFSSLCNELTIEQVKKKRPDLKDKIEYTPSPNGRPTIIVVKEDAQKNKVTAFDLAGFSLSESARWKAVYDDQKETELGTKLSSALEIKYKVKDNEISEIGIKSVIYRFVCFTDEDFDFLDERVVGSSLVLQYNGNKACSINQPKEIDTKWGYAILILIAISIYGLFLDHEHERIVMTLGSVQGAFMTIIGVYIAIGFAGGPIYQQKETLMQVFGVSFMFLSIGLSYFSRYVSLFFVGVASSFAINCTLLYAFCLIFGVYIPTFLFYIGGLICAASLLALMWFSTSFREKYSFTLVSATTNAFYLCGSLAFLMRWGLPIFYFNQYKEFGKVDHVEFKHWAFFLLEVAITVGVAGFRMKQAKKIREEAIAKNAVLFRKEVQGGDVDGYFHPDRGDEDPQTVIAM